MCCIDRLNPQYHPAVHDAIFAATTAAFQNHSCNKATTEKNAPSQGVWQGAKSQQSLRHTLRGGETWNDHNIDSSSD
jgi:hypothetical protein